MNKYMNKYMKLCADFKKTCDNKYLLNDYYKVCAYIDDNFEVIQKFKNPLTGEKFKLLYYKYSTSDIINKLEAMENYLNVEKRNRDVGWTLKDWLNRDQSIKPFNRKWHEAELTKEEEEYKIRKEKKKIRPETIKKMYQEMYDEIPSEPLKSKYKKVTNYICDGLTNVWGLHELTYEQFLELYEDYTIKQIKKALKLIDAYENGYPDCSGVYSSCTYLMLDEDFKEKNG